MGDFVYGVDNMQKGNFLFTIDNDILIIKKNKKVYRIVKNDNNYILMYDGKKVYDN